MRLGEEGFEFKAERKDEGVNHYDVLAVPTTADEAEIRQSCARRLPLPRTLPPHF